jgi:hypothetical protein
MHREKTVLILADYPKCGGCGTSQLFGGVDSWIKVLKTHHVVGFSYWEVTGSATEGVKRGLLWDVTISDENPISRETLISLYAESWQRTSNIYIEEVSVYSAHETSK